MIDSALNQALAAMATAAAHALPHVEVIRNILRKWPKMMARQPKIDADTLLATLDNEKMPSLEKAFNRITNGIPVQRFVELVECAIVAEKTDRVDIIRGLIRLFEDIDINGDGNMEWSEFTQYVVECAREVRSKSMI